MIGNREILAVVTARANSAGCPGKNYKLLSGRPLVQWSILAALKSQYIDHIIVSSNCPHVRAATEAFIQEFHTKKVTFVQRPDELATPTSKNEEALVHAVEQYEEQVGRSPYYVMNLQPTSPIRHKQLLDECILELDRTNCNSLFTAQRHTPFFAQMTSEGLDWHYDPRKRPMRQELNESDWYYHDDGCVYLMTAEHLCNTLCRIDLESVAVFCNYPYCSWQIDEDSDFLITQSIKDALDQTGDYV